MTEIDVTLTDYALAVLCLCFVYTLAARKFKSSALQRLWVLFFSSVALASITGGTVHGFYLDESSLGFKILWPTTLLAIGITASTAWVLAGLFMFGDKVLKIAINYSVVCFVLYAVGVIGFSQSFLIVIANYLPPMIAMLLAAVKEYRRTGQKGFVWIIGGIAVSFVAAFIQQAGVAIHPLYFNHNSTYHLVQAFGLYAIFNGARNLQNFEVANEAS